jgi:hypothetical protein
MTKKKNPAMARRLEFELESPERKSKLVFEIPFGIL